ncbi:putative LOB domain-containing protein [Quillaja saponaria]|uniref:LOB domain-containing protein n=1 Tax=Quillaja saponaria TaxID=32244 RepID=A0AAD7Q6D1_QUISA|nr:putative LOB domain-containing protein [Quillaja saponaria]
MIPGRCAACKSQRKRCPSDCVFSPHFPPDNPERFASVQKIYGASKVEKMLQDLPPYLQAEAANALCFEAQCRIQDPVYGCVGIISQLHQQIQDAEKQLAMTQAQLAVFNSNIPQQLPQFSQIEDPSNLSPMQSILGQFQNNSTSQAPWFN